ncbi:hypothetical protein DOK67_0001754 [Enterococcus sp. DIV0212c]|uniref:DUF488 domain-containing protein n=1 Tax=Enterococcus sp. DIV0212c TaxID=2230867 RepID=UPI001A9B4C90|nr:DUF488 family protein [Enterococcus sp. DIV0212c]MBO1353846.1 DUF488 family protein [Enterococcus sp. DIV0212c]
MLQIKRAYEKIDSSDGYRVLVDRLWPRGMSKEKEQLDLWLKKVAPSKELRQWFNHEPDKYPKFKEKYIAELESGETNEAFQQLLEIVKEHAAVTLIYSAKEEKYNNAVVLKELIEDHEKANK